MGSLARRAFILLAVPSQSQDIHRSGVSPQSYLRMSKIVLWRCPCSPQPTKGRVSAGSVGRQFELQGTRPTPSARACCHLGQDLSTVRPQPLGCPFSAPSFDVGMGLKERLHGWVQQRVPLAECSSLPHPLPGLHGYHVSSLGSFLCLLIPHLWAPLPVLPSGHNNPTVIPVPEELINHSNLLIRAVN